MHFIVSLGLLHRRTLTVGGVYRLLARPHPAIESPPLTSSARTLNVHTGHLACVLVSDVPCTILLATDINTTCSMSSDPFFDDRCYSSPLHLGD